MSTLESDTRSRVLLASHVIKVHLMLEWIFNLRFCNAFSVLCRDPNLDYGKKLAELVDNKLARHYELDDISKKKVRELLSVYNILT